MFQFRDADFYELFEYISPLKLKSGAISLKSMAHFVQAIHYYLHMRTDECRWILRVVSNFGGFENNLGLIKASVFWMVEANQKLYSMVVN